MLIYERHVNVYETDMMGIVHHSNYLRFYEEARVEWCKQKKMLGSHKEAVFGLTVVETRVRHIKPIQYGDLFKVQVQVKAEGVRLFFQYRLYVNEVLMSTAETVHCSLNLDFKVKRLDSELLKTVESEVWTETWL